MDKLEFVITGDKKKLEIMAQYIADKLSDIEDYTVSWGATLNGEVLL